jgi:O-antigen ligase
LGHPWLPFALVAFVTICIGSLISGPSVDGVQNVCTYLIFALSIPVVVSRVSEHTPERFLHAAALVAGAVGTIALASTLIGFPLYDPRAFALASLVFLAVVIPSRSRHPLVRIAPYVLTGAVVVSLSRTATVIAILLLVFIVLRGRSGGRLIRAALLLSVAAAGVVVLWFSYAPFRERFTEGDNAVAINGVLINTSGRTAIWDVLLRNMGNSPLFGHGAGSASTAISAVYPSVGHPHNDYIRILYDFGWPGLCAFLVGYIVLIGWVARRAFGSPADAIHWSALIALIGIGLSALTDNAFVYPFVMFPLGVLVGLSVSRPVQRHSSYGRRNALHPRQHLTSMPVA